MVIRPKLILSTSKKVQFVGEWFYVTLTGFGVEFLDEFGQAIWPMGPQHEDISCDRNPD